MKTTKGNFNFWIFFISLGVLQILQIHSSNTWAQTSVPDSIGNSSDASVQYLTAENDKQLEDSVVRDRVTNDTIIPEGLSEESIDTPIIAQVPDSLPQTNTPKQQWVPNPTRATWLAIIFPGGGQIYNRKYWKLPIFYGGFAGCAYALSWNNNMYKDYSRAYRDLMSDDPSKNSYEDLLPPNHGYSKSQLESVLKNRKDRFRRYRDLSIFAFIGVYILSVIDAYVDAELSNFDITPDLSMRIEPAIMNNEQNFQRTSNKSVGVQCSFTF